MKKLLISVLAVALSWSAMAAPIAVAKITLTGATGGYGELTLYEDDNRTSAYESGYDAPLIGTMENSKSVQLYGFIGSQKYDKIYTNDLFGTEIGFITNQDDANYTLTFNHIYGSDIVLYDRVKHKAVTITSGTPAYTFEAAAGRVEVNNRFVIGVPSYDVTTNADGYASFSCAEDVEIPTGVTVYIGSINGEFLDLVPVAGKIPANTGVIIRNDDHNSNTYTFNVVTDGVAATAVGANDIKPSVEETAVSGTIFCLRNVNGESGLYQYTGATIPAHKAYLQLGAANNAPKRIALRFNEEQGIEDVKADVKAEKFVENGQIFIKRGEAVYNMQGQIVK